MNYGSPRESLRGDGLLSLHVAFGKGHGGAMFGTRKVQDCMIDANQKVGRLAAKSAGQWRLAQVLDQAVADESPKLTWRNPDTSATTLNFC
jgi:ribosomal protein L4